MVCCGAASGACDLGRAASDRLRVSVRFRQSHLDRIRGDRAGEAALAVHVAHAAVAVSEGKTDGRL